MTKRRNILLALSGVLVLAGVLYVICPPKYESEPICNGKTLSEWTMEYAQAMSQESDARVVVNEQSKASVEAIRYIGTNAIPHLVGWIRYETPSWRVKLDPIISKFPGFHPGAYGNPTGPANIGTTSSLAGEGKRLPNPRILTRPYYDRLRQVTERTDWETWVRYFLNGVARQSEDALSRSERINQILESWRSALAGKPNPRIALQMVDLLGVNPFLTPRGAAQKLGTAYNTVMRAIGRLQEHGVVTAISEAKRNRVFYAKALLDILEEPARLTPVEPMRPK